MGTPKSPEPVKLFIGIMHTREFPIDEVITRLGDKFGPVEHAFGPISFSWTDYYAKEMGEDLLKRYFCFRNLIVRDALPAIKLATNAIEMEFVEHSRRRVNIDPGYLSRDKLVLASTKDFFHRMYLADGIYGEVTLHYRREVFRHFSWTYPDYKEDPLHDMLFKARSSLVEEIRSTRGISPGIDG